MWLCCCGSCGVFNTSLSTDLDDDFSSDTTGNYTVNDINFYGGNPTPVVTGGRLQLIDNDTTDTDPGLPDTTTDDNDATIYQSFTIPNSSENLAFVVQADVYEAENADTRTTATAGIFIGDFNAFFIRPQFPAKFGRVEVDSVGEATGGFDSTAGGVSIVGGVNLKLECIQQGSSNDWDIYFCANNTEIWAIERTITVGSGQTIEPNGSINIGFTCTDGAEWDNLKVWAKDLT